MVTKGAVRFLSFSALYIVVSDSKDTPQNNESQIADALKRLRNQDVSHINDVIRQKDVASMKKALRPTSPHPRWIAVAAAAILVLGTGAFVAVSNNSSSTNDQLASDTIDLPDLKEVDFLTPVPFERTEDYVMVSVEASRAKEVNAELEAALGATPSVIGLDDNNTTFVVPASAANQLSNTAGLTVVADTPMKSIAEQTPVPSWGLDRIDAVDTALNNSYKYVSTGTGALVYVIDTGVYAGHSDLSGRVISGYTAVNDGNGTQDCNGHGTHVAGTAAGTTYGVAKNARVVAVRVLDCAGSGYSSSVVAGINWAVASHPGGPGIINLSLGGPANSTVDAAVAAATQAGLVVVVAAGNSGADACNYSPARAASAITIGATDQSDNRAGYSNFGGCVDMYAPGSGITSAWISGASATRTISGTSMAAPHVAGLAARLTQAQPGISSSGIRETLTATNVVSGTLTIANFVEDETPVVTTTSTPGDTTTTTVATSPTTTAPKNGKGSGNTRAPGRNKAVTTPTGFALGYETVNNATALVATWTDDRTPESYAIECTKSAPTPTSTATTRVVVERNATVLNAEKKVETMVALTPNESLFCWVVAFIGSDTSARSNVARINVAPQTGAGKPQTPPANNQGNSGNSGNSNNQGNSGNSGNSNNQNKAPSSGSSSNSPSNTPSASTNTGTTLPANTPGNSGSNPGNGSSKNPGKK